MGYLYVLSNTHLSGLIKVGFTNKHPEVRAHDLSKQTGTIGKYIVEWFIEVEDERLAETHAHKCLKEYHDPHAGKEMFRIGIFEAAQLIVLDLKKRSLISESNEIFESKSLKEFRKNRLEQMVLKAKELIEKLEDIVPEDIELSEELYESIEDEEAVKHPRSSEEKLAYFLEDIYENYENKEKVKFNELLDDALSYVSRLLRKNHSFDVFSTYDSSEKEILPSNLIGIKYRGYFHQIMLIKVIVSEQDKQLLLNSWDKRELRIFGNYVKKRFLEFEFYENIHKKSVVVTVGYALVKKSSNKHFLKEADLLEVYYSNVPKEKEARIKELVSEIHTIKNT